MAPFKAQCGLKWQVAMWAKLVCSIQWAISQEKSLTSFLCLHRRGVLGQLNAWIRRRYCAALSRAVFCWFINRVLQQLNAMKVTATSRAAGEHDTH